jgi:hypothetical protein
MGCDIHAVIEYRISGDMWFVAGINVEIPRDYRLFAAMAGVRNYEEVIPVAAPRGLPTDMDGTEGEERAAGGTTAGFFKALGSDGHTHSWLYTSEFEEALSLSGSHNQPAWALWGYMTALANDGTRPMARIVFCFDN